MASPVLIAFGASIFTWMMTGVGASVVFFVKGTSERFMRCAFAFASGIMLAASFFSLLAPAEALAMEQNSRLVAVSILGFGFIIGFSLIQLLDQLLHWAVGRFGLSGTFDLYRQVAPSEPVADADVEVTATARTTGATTIPEIIALSQPRITASAVESGGGDGGARRILVSDREMEGTKALSSPSPEMLASPQSGESADLDRMALLAPPRARSLVSGDALSDDAGDSATVASSVAMLPSVDNAEEDADREPVVRTSTGRHSGWRETTQAWKKAILLVSSITIHNVPEGVIVGVGCAAATQGSLSFGAAVSLVLGMGIQNIPEGAAVSLPLRRLGVSKVRSFFYGQLSGSIEVLGAVIGAALTTFATAFLPFALSMSAAIMITVVVRELLPECIVGPHQSHAMYSFLVGFLLMMTLDLALG